MNNENKNYVVDSPSEQLKKSYKDSILYVGGTALALAVTVNGVNHANEAQRLDVESTKVVKLDTGDTVWDIASEVDSSQTGKIVDYIVDNSPDLEDGSHVGDKATVPVLKDSDK